MRSPAVKGGRPSTKVVVLCSAPSRRDLIEDTTAQRHQPADFPRNPVLARAAREVRREPDDEQQMRVDQLRPPEFAREAREFSR